MSLAAELSVLESAVNGVRVVLEHLTRQAGGGPDPRALEGAMGLLAIVGARVRLCRRVVIGAEPARTILAPHNAVTDVAKARLHALAEAVRAKSHAWD